MLKNFRVVSSRAGGGHRVVAHFLLCLFREAWVRYFEITSHNITSNNLPAYKM